MNDVIQQLIKQAGSDVSGKWLSLEHAENLANLMIIECKSIIRKEWYEENAKSTDDMDTRSVAIHVGIKGGLNMSLNAVNKHFGIDK